MIKNWLLYLAVWTGCLAFVHAYQEWAAWLIFLCVTFLPILSLLLSLPVMLTVKVRAQMPASVTLGTPTPMQVEPHSPLPLPRWSVRVRTDHSFTGQRLDLILPSHTPTNHCGVLRCKPNRGWIYDYLCLFRFPIKLPGEFCLIIRPKPCKPAHVPSLEELLSHSWRPKPGGGFAENHELRLYRPGDNLRQIHWKLSVKTGDLILREPMVPQDHPLLLWLHLSGDPDTLDRKAGTLLWLSRHLLSLGFRHDILAFCGENSHLWHVDSEHTLEKALDALLALTPAAPSKNAFPTQHYRWQYCIGGEADEV